MSSHDLLLQPVSAGDLIDRSLQLYRRHFASMLAIAAVPGLIAVVGGSLVVLAGPDLRLMMAGHLMTYGAAPILNLMIIGALCKVIADHMRLNEPISFRRTWRIILQHRGRLAATSLIGWWLLPVSFFLIAAAVGILLGIFSLFLLPVLSGRPSSWAIVLPLVVILVGAVMVGAMMLLEVYARVVMMAPAALMEQQTVGSAVSRGIQLGARTSPKVLAVLAFQYCLMWSIATALGVPLGIYAAVGGISMGPDLPRMVAMGFNILAQFGGLLAAPVGVIALALLYFDNRVRKEGLDVEMLAQEIDFPGERMTASRTPALGAVTQ